MESHISKPAKSLTFWRRKSKKVMIILDEKRSGLLKKITENKDQEYQVVYILTDSPEFKSDFHYRSRIYPLKANIRSLLRHDIVDEIICCLIDLPKDFHKKISEICIQFGVRLLVHPAPGLTGGMFTGSDHIGDLPFYVLETSPRNRLAYLVKTVLESMFAAFAMFLLSPLFIVIAILIRLSSSGPVLFKQIRVGLRGRKFYIYKFRTMIDDADKLKAVLMQLNEADGPAFKIKNDPRITPFGRLLRKTGIDELPQLYNVIRGEMSLIGPRPMLPHEVSAQEEWQLKRLCVKPGLTCSWQVEPDRNRMPFDRWMELDRDYVENWSARKDLVLFFKTIRAIFVAKGY
jgi:lipopolysaccharide/colanic/teichoic acid biosynthesis glycosyltransferase